MLRSMRVVFGVFVVACVYPTAASALATIQSVAVTPTPPVSPSTDVTITTDFETTTGIDGFTTSVTKNATSVTVDICVDVSAFTVIDSDTSVENVGTFSTGTVTCLVRLFESNSPGCGILRDTASCDFTVAAATPALAPGGLALLVASIVAAGVLGRSAFAR